jgi:hypothetical protein
MQPIQIEGKVMMKQASWKVEFLREELLFYYSNGNKFFLFSGRRRNKEQD